MRGPKNSTNTLLTLLMKTKHFSLKQPRFLERGTLKFSKTMFVKVSTNLRNL